MKTEVFVIQNIDAYHKVNLQYQRPDENPIDEQD